jgi:hypothetical protein
MLQSRTSMSLDASATHLMISGTNGKRKPRLNSVRPRMHGAGLGIQQKVF